MDKKSKIFFVVFFGVIILITVFSFVKYFVLKDYYIKVEVDCDPQKESCFVYVCDPQEDSECPVNPEERTSYYKFIDKKAKSIPLCSIDDIDCPVLVCSPEEDCQEIVCGSDTVAEGEECSNPESFVQISTDLSIEEIEEVDITTTTIN